MFSKKIRFVPRPPMLWCAEGTTFYEILSDVHFVFLRLSVWPEFGIKSSPNFPKGAREAFTLKVIFLKKPKGSPNIWTTFVKKLTHRTLKIVHFCHTDHSCNLLVMIYLLNKVKELMKFQLMYLPMSQVFLTTYHWNITIIYSYIECFNLCSFKYKRVIGCVNYLLIAQACNWVRKLSINCT